ncbi:NUDIX domain-containing protein [bacterium]|nr:MAG: NUDIX domain-containing protein [bacterium]
MMTEQIQGYSENGELGESLPIDQIGKGLLHAAAHVWIWRRTEGSDYYQILLQKRAARSRTWAGYWDVSTAGHNDAGESPITTAVREASEELGIDLEPAKLSLVGVYRWRQQAVTQPGAPIIIENEFQWLYTYETEDLSNLRYQEKEVDDSLWVTSDQFDQLICSSSELGVIIDHDADYYSILRRHILEQL